MNLQLENSNDNNIILYAVIVGVIFFVFVLPRLEKRFAREDRKLKEKMESLANCTKKIRKLDTNKCSRSCCRYTQWPAPHMPTLKDSKYVGSNLMCNGNGGGCLCVTKEDKDYLARRAQNFNPCGNVKTCGKK